LEKGRIGYDIVRDPLVPEPAFAENVDLKENIMDDREIEWRRFFVDGTTLGVFEWVAKGNYTQTYWKKDRLKKSPPEEISKDQFFELRS
jgi:hypothetical protein